MAMSDYIRNLRDKVGAELLLLPVVGAIVRNEDGESLELQFFHPHAITKLSGFNNTHFARLLDTPFQWDEQWLDKNELSSNPKRT